MRRGPGTALAAAVRSALAGVADLVLPGGCRACDAGEVSAGGLCDACNVGLLSLSALPYCPRCGATLGPGLPVRDDGCWECPNPLPRFASVTRLGPYAGALRQAIRGLKYHRVDALRRRLGAMLAGGVAARIAEAGTDLVLAVPMHWQRRLARGCDHARLLAKTVARELDLPLGKELVRVRITPPQVHLPRSRRVENVRGAFEVSGSVGVEGARVLLIDDVTTTGATANEAARTLLGAGASRVDVAVVAKAEAPRAYADHTVT